MNPDNKTSSSISQVYKNRSHFVLIGLTGRTGSGCTSSAEIMSTSFEKIGAPQPKLIDDNEERKYKIVYSFCERNWIPYSVIHIKDIITSFIIEKPYDEFISFIKKCENSCEINSEKLTNNLNNNIKEAYNKIFEIRQALIKDRKNIEDGQNINKAESQKIRSRLYEFYFELIPPFSKELKDILNKESGNLYTSIYQITGNNLRSSGNAFDDSYDGDNIYRIAIRVNKIIKIIRNLNGRKNKTYIAIDAFRNQFEVSYFRERYSAFYLFAINTEYQNRIKRLQILSDINNKQIQSIDKEYEKKLEGSEVFFSQNIGACIQLADVHINNPEVSVDNLSILKRQIIYYTSLIIHPGLVPPSHLERCMQIAFNAKLNSGCLSRQVGAVITDEYSSVKAVGWNSAPEGQVPCLLRSANDLLNNEDQYAFSHYELNNIDFRSKMKSMYGDVNEHEVNSNKLNGLNLSFCFKDVKNSIDNKGNQVHTRALHAEENAFLQITKYGGSAIKGGMLFVTSSPCELCSKKTYQLGIKTVVYIDPYPGIAKDHILNSGKNKPQLVLFSGAIGRAYNQIYEPILSYKDEIEMILNTK